MEDGNCQGDDERAENYAPEAEENDTAEDGKENEDRIDFRVPLHHIGADDIIHRADEQRSPEDDEDAAPDLADEEIIDADRNVENGRTDVRQKRQEGDENAGQEGRKTDDGETDRPDHALPDGGDEGGDEGRAAHRPELLEQLPVIPRRQGRQAHQAAEHLLAVDEEEVHGDDDENQGDDEIRRAPHHHGRSGEEPVAGLLQDVQNSILEGLAASVQISGDEEAQRAAGKDVRGEKIAGRILLEEGHAGVIGDDGFLAGIGNSLDRRQDDENEEQ